MIDRKLKKTLGQMVKGVQVVGAVDDGVSRLYTSHWVCQVSFDEPIVMASVSPKHDTHPLIAASGRFSVSILAGDQIAEGQYFSYPGRKFAYVATEYVKTWEGLPVVANSIGWLSCEVFDRKLMADHELFFSRVTAVSEGRLEADPLLYSSRHGWRVGGGPAREAGISVRDQLLARLGISSGEGDEAS